MSLRAFTSLLFLTLSTPLAVAQTHFCVGGDLDHLKPADMATCRQKLSNLRSVVAQHGAAADWHFVVVCDEAGWTDYADFVRTTNASLQSAAFDTDVASRRTFIHAAAMGDGIGDAVRVVFAAVPRDSQPVEPSFRVLPAVKRSAPHGGFSVAGAEDPQTRSEMEPATASRGE